MEFKFLVSFTHLGRDQRFGGVKAEWLRLGLRVGADASPRRLYRVIRKPLDLPDFVVVAFKTIQDKFTMDSRVSHCDLLLCHKYDTVQQASSIERTTGTIEQAYGK